MYTSGFGQSVFPYSNDMFTKNDPAQRISYQIQSGRLRSLWETLGSQEELQMYLNEN